MEPLLKMDRFLKLSSILDLNSTELPEKNISKYCHKLLNNI